MRALLPLLLLALPAPALAQASFHASLAAPAPAGRTVAKETLWTCAGTECRAPRSGLSSDMNECRAMARKLGRVTAFFAGERSFAAADLDRCNAGLAGSAGAGTVAGR
jgi:hypothetical protein